MGLGHSPSIVVDGLVFYIDPNNPNCYPGFGNTLYNIVNTSIGGTFVNYTSNPIDNTETRSIFFDGTNDFIQTNYIPYFTSDFTLEVFAKFTRYNDYQCILSSANNGGAGSGFWFEFGTGRGFTIYTTGSQLILEDNIVSLTNLELNKWHHIVATRSGSGTSNLKLYVNNILCGQNTSNAALGHTSFALMVGKYDYVGNYSYFKGNVGSVKIYNKGLNTDEILQNYNATKKKYSPEENIVTNGLVLNIDPGKNTSYSGIGNTIYNSVGIGYTGTLTNGPTFSELNAGSIVFDGSNDFITFPSNSIFDVGTGDFTVVVWHKTLKRSTSTILCVDDGNGGGIILYTYLGVLRNWVAGTPQNGNIDICKGNWNHVVLRRLSGLCTQYIDTIPDAIFSASGSVASSGRNLSIGKIGNEFYYSGNISQALFYNRALSATEILQNYNATKNRFVNVLPPVRNGLVLELDAGQRSSYPGTGNTWYDLSGNSLNGTLTNGPTFSGIAATSSLVFDRTNDHILIADNSLLNTFTGMTLEVIVKYTTTNDQIFAQKANYSLGGGYTIEIYSSGIAAFCYGSSGSSYLNVAVSSYPANNIYHMLFTLSGNTQTLYINGVSVATNSGGSLPNLSGTVFKIGDRTGTFATSSYFGGNVYLTKFYNRGLSAYEVKQNFDYYRTRYNI